MTCLLNGNGHNTKCLTGDYHAPRTNDLKQVDCARCLGTLAAEKLAQDNDNCLKGFDLVTLNMRVFKTNNENEIIIRFDQRIAEYFVDGNVTQSINF